jgi:hypothetical protein
MVLIIGMNNPYSDRADTALLPYPRVSAGWRLWKMVHDVSGISRAEWCKRTDRRNLIDNKHWDLQDAMMAAEGMREFAKGRDTILLGKTVLNLLGDHVVHPLRWYDRPEGTRVALVPHPSGLNRWYNDDVHRWATGAFLSEVLEGG